MGPVDRIRYSSHFNPPIIYHSISDNLYVPRGRDNILTFGILLAHPSTLKVIVSIMRQRFALSVMDYIISHSE